jgi:hypothetical protein
MSANKKATRRPCIKVTPPEKRTLEELYIRKRVPTDQFKERPDALAMLVDDWCKLTGRVEAVDEVARYMINRRKNHDWPTLGDDHLPSPQHEELTADERDILVQIYVEDVLVFGRASDILSSDEQIRDLVSREFAAKTNRIVPGLRLAAILEAMRKGGLLPLLADIPNDQMRVHEDGAAFSDIDQADHRKRHSEGA